MAKPPPTTSRHDGGVILSYHRTDPSDPAPTKTYSHCCRSKLPAPTAARFRIYTEGADPETSIPGTDAEGTEHHNDGFFNQFATLTASAPMLFYTGSSASGGFLLSSELLSIAHAPRDGGSVVPSLRRTNPLDPAQNKTYSHCCRST